MPPLWDLLIIKALENSNQYIKIIRLDSIAKLKYQLYKIEKVKIGRLFQAEIKRIINEEKVQVLLLHHLPMKIAEVDQDLIINE